VIFVFFVVRIFVVRSPQMSPMTGRVWGAGKVLVLAGALAATFVLFAGVAMRVALRAREVQVPPLVGQSPTEATKTLTDLGLAIRIDENRRPDPKVPAGSIMLQDPLPGVPARRQRTIRVWLSAGARTTKVPELIGQTERTARIRLEQDAMQVASVTEFRSPDFPADAVVAQDPPPESVGNSVSLLLNRGEQASTFVMPDVIGTDGTRAAEALRNGGFRVTITGSQPYPGVPANTVVRQLPAAGFRVAQADSIALEVSR
jgi:eukaryotic-like serine/threonine-protein kinase